MPDPASRIGFITDIDDTILSTGMTEGLKALRRTLLRDAYGRKPIPGTPSLYRGLARGTDTSRPESTFFMSHRVRGTCTACWRSSSAFVDFREVRCS